MKIIFLLFFVATPSLFAQFDSLLFQVNLSPYKYGVVALGDQNNDGCDDILIYDCNQNKAMIFFGGSPMSTTPMLEITFTDIDNTPAIKAMDINADGKKDVLISYRDTNDVAAVKIYFGGANLDNTIDIVLHGPPDSYKSYGAYLIPLKDFDGDGKDELMVFDAYNESTFPFSVGTFYIYRASSNFDTIPYRIIKGDSVNNKRLLGSAVTTGDLDGDGLTDFAITGVGMDGSSNEYISFYRGNTDWNTTPFVTFYKNEHTFDPTSMKIIEDINGDKKDDIMIKSYGSFYPDYYLNSILYGSIPIDTVPDIGLNTQNNFIFDVVAPGDINGDGYNDLLAITNVGFYRQARLWVGGNPMPDLREQFWGGDENGYGELIGKVRDINGDGLDDICVGQSGSQSICSSGFVSIYAGDTLFRQPTDVFEEKYNLPEKYHLDNPYPNPFNPETVIRYQLSGSGYVSLKVYDILGRGITELVNEEQPAGEHELTFNASKLSSGMYFITLTATTKEKIYSATKKIIITK